MITLEVTTTDHRASLRDAERLGLDASVLTLHSPSGGWPEIRVAGEREPIIRFLARHNYGGRRGYPSKKSLALAAEDLLRAEREGGMGDGFSVVREEQS